MERDDDVFEFQCSVYDLYNRGGVIDQQRVYDEHIDRDYHALDYHEHKYCTWDDDPNGGVNIHHVHPGTRVIYLPHTIDDFGVFYDGPVYFGPDDDYPILTDPRDLDH